MTLERAEVAIVGGGLVGLSVAYGLRRLGIDVVVLDTCNAAAAAYRANFGLIWTQTKGIAFRPYATLSRQAAALWPDFGNEIEGRSDTDIGLEMTGGIKLCHSHQEMETYGLLMARQFDTDLPVPDAYTQLDRKAIGEILPDVGPSVVGGFLCKLDGALNPIRLFTALRIALQKMEARILSDRSVEDIHAEMSGYRLTTSAGMILADKVVLAAGLGNRTLGTKVGLNLSVEPIRGQILVTQRLERFIGVPTHVIRQTSDASVIIGDSKEDVGIDDGNNIAVMGDIARRAIASFPRLADVSIVRAWGGLRIMTPDGSPIYASSRRFPGVFAINVHSGVTLAPIHAGPIAGWIAGHAQPLMGAAFAEERFHAQAA